MSLRNPVSPRGKNNCDVDVDPVGEDGVPDAVDGTRTSGKRTAAGGDEARPESKRPRGPGAEAEGQEPIDVEQPDGDEGVRPRVLRGPVQPTFEERELHKCTHIPYRSWCKACVLGQCPDNASNTVNDPGGR